ncbi:MAG: twin-arginine translocase subunit TatC, partial [Gammaproteobacteria bacterium]|nr:twin-arginine translocase subunit TatC [Gammaproteobacteria bacterium]
FAFEVPVITVLLVLTNVSTPTSLSKKRPYVIVGAFVIGMLLTPPDVISQTLLAIPIWFLFEVGIIFARILTKHRNDSGVILYDDIDKNNDKKDDK